jgi:hypothetical protein
MHYHVVLLNVFTQYITDTSKVKESGAYEVTPQEIVSTALRRLGTLLRVYEFRHGFQIANCLLLAIFIQAAFSSLGDLGSVTSRDTFLLSVRGLRCLSRYYYLAEAFLRAVRTAAKGVNLEAHLLKDSRIFRTEEQRAGSLVEHIQSQWPMNYLSLVGDPSDWRLDNLIKAYQDLSINELNRIEDRPNHP